MNHLQYETSPYLLQHAHNPVDWYPWKDEAFERAREEDKPVLVSIGYSTCHWCHVMERESFENEEVAAFMNEHFINIKVDREERPDVDQIYMEACQAITGGGGWPLNAFLLPDGRPFYAGTYYPPRPAYNRPSWLQVLQHLLRMYREQRDVVEDQALRLTTMIENTNAVFIQPEALRLTKEQLFTEDSLHNVFARLRQGFDTEQGGFGSAPKFPGAMTLRFLLAHHHFTGETEALAHVHLSLHKMIRGGIYDQLGGGFARYATDRNWLVPHFEKMLYDNALLVTLLSEACQQSGESLYRETIEETLAFVEREMTSAEGGFYAALDADSEGVEGKFYVWDKEEIDHLLGKEARLFCLFYGVTPGGNWEGHNILWRPQSFTAFAAAHQMSEADLRRQLEEGRRRLFEARSERVRPGLDDKIILSWNALMCSAYAHAYAALGREDYRTAARRNLGFLLTRLRQPDGKSFFHTYKDGKARYHAFLDDYALLIEALLTVYSITFDTSLLNEAEQLTEWVISEFLDADGNLFYFTTAAQQDVIVRKKELYDNAVPSGNSTMVHNLYRLGILAGREDYRELAVDLLKSVKESVEQYPSSFARWARALMLLVYPVPEIAVLGPEAPATARAINRQYVPQKVIMASSTGTEKFPLLADKGVTDDTKIYVCQNYTCEMPVQSLSEFSALVSPHRKNGT